MARRLGRSGGVWICLFVAAWSPADASAAGGRDRCDELPTGVAASDHTLTFTVPPGLMPDKRFDGRPAQLDVHRVRPAYANGRCPGCRRAPRC